MKREIALYVSLCIGGYMSLALSEAPESHHESSSQYEGDDFFCDDDTAEEAEQQERLYKEAMRQEHTRNDAWYKRYGTIVGIKLALTYGSMKDFIAKKYSQVVASLQKTNDTSEKP